MGNIHKIKLTIRMPKYLQYFIRYRFLSGNSSCSAKNEFNAYLFPLLTIFPHSEKFEKNNLENKDEVFTFELPTFKGKDPLYYNYISEEANDYLIMIMRKLFNMLILDFMASYCKWYIQENGKIKICHSERTKAIELWCFYNGVPSKYINIDTVKRYFTKYIREKRDYIVANRQLELNIVTPKTYIRKKKEKKNLKYAYIEDYQFDLGI